MYLTFNHLHELYGSKVRDDLVYLSNLNSYVDKNDSHSHKMQLILKKRNNYIIFNINIEVKKEIYFTNLYF